MNALQQCYAVQLVAFSISFSNAQLPDFNLDANYERECNSIRQFLVNEAARITDGFADRMSTAVNRENQRTKQRKLIEILGLKDVLMGVSREAPIVKYTGVIEMETYRIEKNVYQSLPGHYVPANLYIPKNLQAPAPSILYVCGHSRVQKAAAKYQGNARKLADLDSSV